MDLFDGPDDFLEEAEEGPAVPADVAGVVSRLKDDNLAEVTKALEEIAARELAPLQDAVAGVLLRPEACEDRNLVEAVLSFLATHGDGRCVRTMELVM